MIWFSTYENTFRHVVTGILGATVEGQLDTTNDHTNDCASQRWGRHCRCHVQLGMVVMVMGAIMMVKVVMEVMMVKVLFKIRHYLASGGGAMMNNTGKLVTAVKSDSLNWGTWTCFYWAWNYYITFLMLIKWKYSPQSWMGMSPASATERRVKARRTQSIFWKNFIKISVQVHLAFRWVQICTNTEEVARAGRLFMSEPNQKYK